MNQPKIIKHIQQKLSSPSHIGLEMVITSEQIVFNLVELAMVNQQLVTDKTTSGIIGWEQLKDTLDDSLPIHLSINGKGLLHKKMEASLNDDQIVPAVLPNAHPDDFYWQKFKTESGYIVSLIRKSQLDEVLAKAKELDLWITQMSLGSFSIQNILPALSEQNSIPSYRHILHFNQDKMLTSWEENTTLTNEEIQIGGDYINSFLLPAYTAAFQSLTGDPSGVPSATIDNNKKEYFHKTLFLLARKGVAALFLTILLLNTFLYYNFKDKNTAIRAQLLNVDHQLIAIDSMKKKINQQRELLQHTSIQQNTSTSYYADQIASLLPDGINLELLEIFPKKEKKVNRRKKQLIKYDKESISIKGTCKSSLVYNKWLKDLQTMSWIKTTKHIDYQDIDHQLAAFELKITLKPSK